jgi:hypothetical protein
MGDLALVISPPICRSSELTLFPICRFGGGFEMLRDGEDLDGVGERIRGYTK